MLAEVNDENFEKEVLESDQPVLIDFYAPWCPPCHIISPVVEELAEEYKDRLKVYKMDLEKNSIIPRKYDVTSIPRLVLFKGGEPIALIVGLVSKNVIEDMITGQLGPESEPEPGSEAENG